MIRLAVRQFRLQAAITFGALGVFAVAVWLSGLHIEHLYDSTVLGCTAKGDCDLATTNLLSTYGPAQAWLDAIILVLPAVLGVFWGAPLISREFETGTYRLVWTQSITRGHWLLAKIAIVGTASVAVTAVASVLVTWWFSPIDLVRMEPFVMFDWRDVVPLGYAAFAFALGMTLGMLIRRTVPAMAATIAGFIVVRMGFVRWVRPNLLTPIKAAVPFVLPAGNAPVNLGAGAVPSNDWVLSNLTINSAGKVIGSDGGFGPSGQIDIGPATGHLVLQGAGSCPNISLPTPSQLQSPSGLHSGHHQGVFSSVNAAIDQCAHQLGIRELVTYQPAIRYWPMQWIELTIFVAFALALCGFCLYWLRRVR
jgi:ABC-2 family transporter protein